MPLRCQRPSRLGPDCERKRTAAASLTLRSVGTKYSTAAAAQGRPTNSLNQGIGGGPTPGDHHLNRLLPLVPTEAGRGGLGRPSLPCSF
jgi:hypothetical protein